MARIRTVKPEFFTNEKLSGLPADTHLLAAALLCYADDEGFFLAHPGLVRASCMPLREDYRSPTVMLQELSNIGFLELQNGLEGKALGKIAKFCTHQSINKPTASKIKPLWKLPEGYGSTPGGLPGGTGNREQGKEKEKGEKEKPEPASCEPLPASLPSTPTSVDPENNPELRQAANLAALASPFFQAKPAVQATAVTVTARREVYRAADWEVANDPTRKLSFADALASLRKLFEKHQRGSPDEFHSYDAKPMKFYLADKPFHNRPKKPLALVKPPMRTLDAIAREERAKALEAIAKENVQ